MGGTAYEQYPWYQEWRRYFNKRETSFNLTRLYISDICKGYAETHPDTPFHAEILAIAALYDGHEESSFWTENYKEKFNSPVEVITSFKSKAADWLPEHDDVELRCIRAAVTLLTEDLYDPVTIFTIGQDLYEIMTDSKTHSGYLLLWLNVATAADFFTYLEGMKEASSKSKAFADICAHTGKENFKDENTYTTAIRAALSDKAAIVYSYKHTPSEILTIVLSVVNNSIYVENGRTYRDVYDFSIDKNGSVCARGRPFGMYCSLVECLDDGFAAVVITGFPHRDIADSNVVKICFDLVNHFFVALQIDGAEAKLFASMNCKYEVLYDITPSSNDLSLYASTCELATAFQSAIQLKPPYISKVNRAAITEPDWFTARKSTTSGGCYIATSVYGSYDCPEVWTLRRFRDFSLAKTWYGQAFIKSYYAVSPILVKWFGNTKWFKAFWRVRLDKLISNLRVRGFDDTPYVDKM